MKGPLTIPEAIRMASRFRSLGMAVFIYDEGEELPSVYCVGDESGEALGVLSQLRQLEAEGKVTLEIWIRCQDGHEIWRGPAAQALGPWTRCALCALHLPKGEEIEVGHTLIATMTPAWKAALV